MATVQIWGPYTYYLPTGFTWAPGTHYYPWWRQPSGINISNGAFTFTAHAQTGDLFNIAVGETRSRVDTYGRERYVECDLINVGHANIFVFHAYVSLIQP